MKQNLIVKKEKKKSRLVETQGNSKMSCVAERDAKDVAKDRL